MSSSILSTKTESCKLPRSHSVFVPLQVITDARLSHVQRKVLLALYSFRNRDTGIAFPTRAKITERTGIRPADVSLSTTALVELGWVTKTGNGGCSRSSDYLLHLPACLPDLGDDRFIVFPREVLGDSRLNKVHIQVLLALFAHHDGLDKPVFPTRKEIELITGVHPNRISGATTDLVEFGWIAKTGKGGCGLASLYFLQMPDELRDAGTKERLEELVSDSRTVVDKCAPEAVEVPHENPTRPVSKSQTRGITENRRGNYLTKEQTKELKTPLFTKANCTREGDFGKVLVLPDWVDGYLWWEWSQCWKPRADPFPPALFALNQLARWRDQGRDFNQALRHAIATQSPVLFEPDLIPKILRKTGKK